MSRFARARTLLMVLAVAACGGAKVDPVEPTPLPTTEPEGMAVQDVIVTPVTVDLVSLIPQGADMAVVVRVDLLRGSRLGPVAAQLLQSVPELRALAASGFDPLQDVDRILIAGRESSGDPDVIAFEHRWTEAQLLEIYTRLAEAPPGTMVQMEEAGRFRVATVPGSEASLLLLNPTVAAFAPPAMVQTLLERGQAPGSDVTDTGRRLRLLDGRAPDLAASGVVRVSATDATGRADWGRETSQIGIAAPRWVTAVAALDDGATAFAEGGYATEAEAQGAEQGIRALLTQSTSPAALLLRLMGLGRALQASRVTRDGTSVTFRTHLAADELDRVLERVLAAGP